MQFRQTIGALFALITILTLPSFAKTSRYTIQGSGAILQLQGPAGSQTANAGIYLNLELLDSNRNVSYATVYCNAYPDSQYLISADIFDFETLTRERVQKEFLEKSYKFENYEKCEAFVKTITTNAFWTTVRSFEVDEVKKRLTKFELLLEKN